MAKDDSVAKSGNQQLPVENKVESLIRVIRGQQVMLDRDLAELYGVETVSYTHLTLPTILLV